MINKFKIKSICVDYKYSFDGDWLIDSESKMSKA